MKLLIHEMTAEELSEALKRTDTVIVPLGSVEQHGPHLPVSMDAEAAYLLAIKAAEAVDGGGVYVAPPIFYGSCAATKNFPGTISIRQSTLIALIIDVLKGFASHGFKKFVILNCHGGNNAVVRTAIRELMEEGFKAFVGCIHWWGLIQDVVDEVREAEDYGHACEIETSFAYVLIPEKVRVDKIVRGRVDPEHFYPRAGDIVNAIHDWTELTETGIKGDPTKASREKGERMLTAFIERVKRSLEALRDAKVN